MPTFFAPVQNNPPRIAMNDDPGTNAISPLCMVCAHLHRKARPPACDAFPGGIPEDILAGRPHVTPYPGDRGIEFRKTSGEPSFFIVGSHPGTLFRVTCAGSYERYVPILDLWELDNMFICYVLSVPLPIQAVDPVEADAFVDSARKCLDAMNPCMREVRRMMYLSAHGGITQGGDRG
ncbi:MAG TPA: hypothetical protein HA264_00320 [Methanolinea sp.]|jgi:hypothetical protein|nr:MAG: hypothetical protein A4E36_00544 [Methanoregulaceae archaeon PtaB.Bin009]OPY41490.1 MAG: hypothetical protein A4E41_00915 [Methanoregulaceae archaeon PtaU1.Bin066]HII75506.1 hypothetical protein [Methanolinea sp.]HNQ29932.1 hypothetical protein [Methanolinea sp.]